MCVTWHTQRLFKSNLPLTLSRAAAFLPCLLHALQLGKVQKRPGLLFLLAELGDVGQQPPERVKFRAHLAEMYRNMSFRGEIWLPHEDHGMANPAT